MGIGNGSLGRVVFQGSSGGVFQGSCRARRDASYSPISQLASTLLECSPILALSCFALISARSATIRHMDAHEERLLRRTRKRSRLQDSLPSLNERETLHTAQRVGFFVLSGPYLCVLLVLSLSLVILLIFFHLLEDVHCSFETFLTSAFLSKESEISHF